MNERIRELRKYLNLNQTNFGKRIGVKQTTIAGYETGAKKPLDTVITSICREFNVNINWLLYGKGNMFNELSTSIIETEMLASGLNPNSNIYKLINSIVQSYQKLTPDNQAIIDDFIDNILNPSSQPDQQANDLT